MRLVAVGVVTFLIGLAIPTGEPPSAAVANAFSRVEELEESLDEANAANEDLRGDVDDLSEALAELTEELADAVAATEAAESAAEEAEAAAAEAEAAATEVEEADDDADGEVTDDEADDPADESENTQAQEEAAASDDNRDGATQRTSADDSSEAPAGTWTVTRLVDGDTIDVRSASGVEERVRVIGIDTPERGECGFSEATDALAAVIGNSPVTLVEGGVDDRDRYNRILRYVDVDGVDAGLELIKQGWAISRYDSRDGYGRHLRQDAYIAADTANEHQCGVTNQSGGGSGSSGSSGSSGGSSGSSGNSGGSSGGTSAGDGAGVVKKSNSDICHAPGTTYYSRTTNYTSFDTIEACLESGGRLPRG